MGFSTLKTMFAGVTMLLATSLLFADQVVDEDFDDNQNELEYYWYYYEDNTGVGPNDRPQLFPELTPTVVDVPFTEHERNGYNGENPDDKWMVKDYTFQTTEHMGKRCATMPFTFGDAWEADYCSAGKACAMPFVGIGTMLTRERTGIDITGATAVKFSIKSRVNTLAEVTFKIETLDINEYAYKPGDQMNGDEFGYYGKTITVEPGEWQEFEIAIDELKLPGTWAADFDFDITQCTKLAWEVKGDGEMTVDTLDIADVSFVGTWEFISPWMWMETATAKPSASLFSHFDQAPYHLSPLGTYWYAYNDGEIGGQSAVAPDYAYQDPETGRLTMEFKEGTGFGDAGQGAALIYALGPPIPKDTISILGFVGIGVNLYDSAKSTYYDATAEGVHSVYFDYITDAGAKYVTLEVSDINDVGDATDPTRRESRGSGIVYSRNFPPTNGAWRSVQIPFDSLKVHDDWQGYVDIPLDLTKLAKLQWKVTGGEGTEGYYAIDNIALPDGQNFGVSVKSPAAGMAKAAMFNAVYKNGAVNVNWTGAAKLANGTVRLVNTRGAVIASENISGNTFASKLSTANVAAGMYFVALEGTDVNGKAVASRTVMNIVK